MFLVDLFASIGGLSLGFKLAGFEVVGVELSQRRAAVYARHVGRAVVADARTMDFSRWRGADVVIAGPPCRPYSYATPKSSSGEKHPEYGLDMEVARAVAAVGPRAVAVEEVPGWRPDALARALRGLGYAVHYELVDFSEFGVPVKRKRWLLIAAKGVSPQRIFRELYKQREEPPPVAEVLKDLPEEPCELRVCRVGGRVIYDHVAPEVRSRLRDIMPLIPPGMSLVQAHRSGLLDASPYVNLEKKHSYWMYRLPLTGPAKVVPHPRRSLLLHPTQHRLVTVRELARVHTFPDTFSLDGLTIDDAMRSIADSVPPRFSHKLGRVMFHLIK